MSMQRMKVQNLRLARRFDESSVLDLCRKEANPS